MGNGVKYPIGEQDFKNLRNGGNLYVDKTRFIDRMLSEGG
ncbi:MAG: AAA family ATPase, partial [Bacteroides sp.]|nr:AAA family ATPase [Bacteroides sp.]